jgi:hypothetical protein
VVARRSAEFIRGIVAAGCLPDYGPRCPYRRGLGAHWATRAWCDRGPQSWGDVDPAISGRIESPVQHVPEEHVQREQDDHRPSRVATSVALTAASAIVSPGARPHRIAADSVLERAWARALPAGGGGTASRLRGLWGSLSPARCPSAMRPRRYPQSGRRPRSRRRLDYGCAPRARRPSRRTRPARGAAVVSAHRGRDAGRGAGRGGGRAGIG